MKNGNLKLAILAFGLAAAAAQAGTYTSSKEYKGSRGCGIVGSFLVRIANRAGVSATYACEHKGDNWYGVQVQWSGSPGGGSITEYSPTCIGGDGFPFVTEASAFINTMGGRITNAYVNYEIGGPAFCAPGWFNYYSISWAG